MQRSGDQVISWLEEIHAIEMDPATVAAYFSSFDAFSEERTDHRSLIKEH